MGSSSSKSREVTSAESQRSVSRNFFQNNCVINKSSCFKGIDDNDATHDDDEQVIFLCIKLLAMCFVGFGLLVL
jgi:hypothetical protein